MLSICLVACKSKADIKPSYSIQSNSDGYIIGSFDISDIKIKITEGDKVTYVPVSEDMLDRAYSFNKPGNYAVTVSYENFSETIIIIMKENSSSTGDGDNSGDNGGKQNPPTNGYKEIIYASAFPPGRGDGKRRRLRLHHADGRRGGNGSGRRNAADRGRRTHRAVRG